MLVTKKKLQNLIKCDTYKENKDWIVEIKSKEESKTHAIIKFY